MSDISKQLEEAVRHAYEQRQALHLQGSGSKSFMARPVDAEPLECSGHSGILSYEPSELVITARTGTSLNEINQILAAQGQQLAFEPPDYNGKATLGGTIAAGVSGPARPWTGAARDFMLGCKIINGKGEILAFGGQVMKNVAGYDVSRLMTAAFGSLGVLLEVSLKVLPRPVVEQTQCFEMDAPQAIQKMNQWAGSALPLSAACWYGGQLMLRFCGTRSGIQHAVAQTGGTTMKGADVFWQQLRDHQHDFFVDAQPLWRLSLPPASEHLPLSGDWFIDWGGAQRWLKTTQHSDDVIQATTSHGGHYNQWHSAEQKHLRTPLDANMLALHKNLKDAFDPHGILNPGILYPDL